MFIRYHFNVHLVYKSTSRRRAQMLSLARTRVAQAQAHVQKAFGMIFFNKTFAAFCLTHFTSIITFLPTFAPVFIRVKPLEWLHI